MILSQAIDSVDSHICRNSGHWLLGIQMGMMEEVHWYPSAQEKKTRTTEKENHCQIGCCFSSKILQQMIWLSLCQQLEKSRFLINSLNYPHRILANWILMSTCLQLVEHKTNDILADLPSYFFAFLGWNSFECHQYLGVISHYTNDKVS